MTAGVLEQLAEQAPPPEVAARLGLPPGPLRLRRAWPRAAGHLLLEYEAAGGAVVPGQWHGDPADARRALAGLDDELAALYDLAGGRGSVALQLRGADRRLPGLAPLLRRPGGRLLVHQPERRAVVRLEGPGPAVFVKLVRPERAAAVATAGAAAAALGAGAFDTPRLLAVDPAAGAVTWSALPGVALHELRATADLERGAAAAGRALRALHGSPPPAAAPLHGPDAEVATLERWARLVAAFDPAVGERVAALAPAVQRGLAARGALALVHRDFYDRQVLITAGWRVGLLDFDTLARGEPALDLANALVHCELRALQGLVAAAASARAQAALLAGYGPGPEVRERLGAYAAATRLRLACVYSFRPRWRRCVPALLERCRRGLR